MNLFALLLFMLLPVSGLAYVGWHVWLLLPLAPMGKSVVVALCVTCFLLLFYAVSPGLDALPMPLASSLYNIGTSSLIVLLYLFMLFLLLDLGRLCRLVPRSLLHDNGWSALCILVVMFGTFLYGYLHYRHKVRVPLTIESSKPLPRSYRVVMASDLHLGYHNDRRELARWVDMMNAERPDLILIAGDIIDRSVRPLLEEDMAAEFRRLEAPVYACLGNHEYYSGCPQARQFYRDAGIHLLSDEAILIDSALVIIGRDDRTNPRRKSLATLMSAANSLLLTEEQEGWGGKSLPLMGELERAFTILLDHQPHDLGEAEQAGIDFQLSGHTHRGQVWPASWATDLMYECSWGSHRRGRTQYYVSSGLGIWGGRFRIGTQSEYVVATIQSTR
ncbi:MAG: metallophosphoesterase [Bacteroidaceae bacterium]|nr:metallophosphoesterase [Bacteroidaceae bacterium]